MTRAVRGLQASFEQSVIQTLSTRSMTTDELESYLDGLADDLGYAKPPTLELLRMNTIGTLRNLGYIIPRIRGIYSIAGFEEKVPQKTADMWEGEQQELLAWFDSLPDVTWDHLVNHLRKFSKVSHALSPGAIMCYDLAKDRGKILPDGSIAIRKFESSPRFRIAAAIGSEETLEFARTLNKISVRKVRVSTSMNALAKPFALYGMRQEAVYDCKDVAETIEQKLNKRGREVLRRNLREIEFTPCPPTDLATTILDIWKAGPAGQKQRQLAIGRDYVAAKMMITQPDYWATSFIGMRRGLPTSLHILSRLPGNPNYVAQIVEKSLNYSSLPGGYNGTTNANIYLTCEKLLQAGIEYIAAGDYNGGTEGLTEHKRLLANRALDIRTPEYELQEPCFVPESIGGAM